MNVNSITTRDYGDKQRFWLEKNKANFIVQRSAFRVQRQNQEMLFEKTKPICERSMFCVLRKESPGQRTVPARREKSNFAKQSQFH